jgi:hypothetical protein
MYRSIDNGASWVAIPTPQFSTAATRLIVAPSDPAVLYATTMAGGQPFSWRSSDAGTTWRPSFGNGYSVVGVSSTNPSVAYGQFGTAQLDVYGLYVSSDGGLSEQPVSTGAPRNAPISRVLTDPANPSKVYAAVGFFNGQLPSYVYGSTDGGMTWSVFGQGERSSGVSEMLLSADGSELYAASRFGGVEVVDLAKGPTGSPPSVTSVSATVGPTTPLWHLDLALQLSNVSCPSSITLTIQGRSEGRSVCQAGQTAPTSFRWPDVWPVYEGAITSGVAPYQLPIASTVPVTASITGGAAQFSGSITTPTAPVWIGVGDSYSSGHHQTVDLPGCVTDVSGFTVQGNAGCKVFPNDSDFSWVQRATTRLNAPNGVPKVPSLWRMQPIVTAISGEPASSYSLPYHDSFPQATLMTQALSKLAGSWDVLSLTGGANDIDFAGVLRNWYVTHRFGKPWESAPRANNSVSAAQACPDSNALYRKIGRLGPSIVTALQSVIDSAQATSTSVRVIDLKYPYLMATGGGCANDYYALRLGRVRRGVAHWYGATATIDRLDSLHDSLQAKSLRRIDLRGSFGSQPLGKLQLNRFYGYPHPSDLGQADIAAAAADAAA